MIAEPVTVLTDYLLAGASAWLGARLWRNRAAQRARAYWSIAFFALALGALLGGTWHGVAPWLSAGASRWLWYATVVAVGAASFAMLAGSAWAACNPALRTFLAAFAAGKFALFAAWMLAHKGFIYVVADSGTTMAAVIVLHGYAALRHADMAARWLLAGVAVSILAALVQASGFALHRHFNHNDLYHVVQIAAMFLLWRGAAALRDRARP